MSLFIIAIDKFFHFIFLAIILFCALTIVFFNINVVIFSSFIRVIDFCGIFDVLSTFFSFTQLIFVVSTIFVFIIFLELPFSFIIIAFCFSIIVFIFICYILLISLFPTFLRILLLYVNQPLFSIVFCLDGFFIFLNSFSSSLLHAFFLFCFLILILLLVSVCIALLLKPSIFPSLFQPI